jgi:peptidyl-prolyl cis-trans isomerase SurA
VSPHAPERSRARRTSRTRARLPLRHPMLLLALAPLLAAGCRRTPDADVVATVNKHPITTVELDRAYNDQLGDAANQTEKPTAEAAESLRLGLLRDLIDQEIVEQRAAKMNLTATPEEVDA